MQRKRTKANSYDFSHVLGLASIALMFLLIFLIFIFVSLQGF